MIQNSSASNSEIAYVGDTPISMKLLQSIYNELTGKKEKLIRSLKDAHEIVLDDIDQLNLKINQLYEQYNIISKNCSVTIFHVNDCKEQFSTFERFKLYDTSATSPCENIHIEYSFLILLPNTNKPQDYRIEIDLQSRTGIYKKQIAEHGEPRRFFRYMGMYYKGNIQIEYIDYTVARNFLVAIEQWYESIKKNRSSKLVTFLQDYSEHFPFIFQIVSCLTLVFSIHSQTEKFISHAPSLTALFSGLIIAGGAIYAATLISRKMGQLCEYAIDSYQPISFIKINRGDAKAISEFQQSNKRNFTYIAISSTTAIIINLLSAYIAILIGISK